MKSPTTADERVRVSCAADELSRISPELLAHVFVRYPGLREKCEQAMKQARRLAR